MKRVFVLILAIAAVSSFKLAEQELHSMEPAIPPFVPEDRITGGTAIPITSAPWQIGLLINNAYWCGGSLISTTWVVTAAHCVSGYSASQFIVYLGNAAIRGGIQKVPTQAIVHSGWNPNTLLNDIALLKITAVTLSTSIQPVILPASSSYSVAAGTLVTATGWGKTSDTSSTSSTLQSVNLEVITNTKCALSYGTIVTSSNICVATPNGKSTCNGDSGGPLVDASTKVLVGLTSFGSSAGCTRSYPAAFTRISSYRTWITSNTGV